MSNDPNTTPIPMLGYYEEQRFAPFVALRRFVLLAGAVAGFVDLTECAAELARAWPSAFNAAMGHGFPSSLEGFAVSVAVLRFFFSMGAVLGCLMVIGNPRARTSTLVAEAAMILSGGCICILQVGSFWSIRRASGSADIFMTLAVQWTCGFLRQSLIPLLVIVVLTQRRIHALARP